MSNFLKSWAPKLTSLLSIIYGIFQASGAPTLQAAIANPQVQMAAIMAFLGLVTKQTNVTGGSVGQPSTPEAIHVANQAPSVVNPPIPSASK